MSCAADTWQCLQTAASSCTSDEGVVWRASYESNNSPLLDPLPYRESPDCLTASSGASMQMSALTLEPKAERLQLLCAIYPQSCMHAQVYAQSPIQC